ncbi:hypothetical protein HYC85_010866 [Camellia sinensis]|uniref:F-box associated beta-propeller type 3 domain-containing protein n=1 Tax=Camellia sinensis TaxID=4442 RepID=A0A7J7HJ47_CAMSI|nr:hypothetical protein HYC85_010866 [Camellia sinensis]
MIVVQSFDEPKTTTFDDPIWLRLLETLFPKSHYIGRFLALKVRIRRMTDHFFRRTSSSTSLFCFLLRFCMTVGANELFPACHIAFIPHTGEYKVVCHCVSLRGVHRWLVLTVGKNMLWRKLETPLTGNNLDYVEQTSVTIGGVLYWSQRSSGIYAIDLCDESSYSIQVPNEFVEESYWLLELGHRLSCLVNHQREIHVCILKDMHRSEWDKLYKVREVIDTQKFSFRTFIPVGWMDNGQLLIFIIRRFGNWKERLIGAYNVKTGETKAFNDFDTQLIHLHTNGLASW